MNKTKFILLALVGVVITSCSSDEYVGAGLEDGTNMGTAENIGFGSLATSRTRGSATHEKSAELLGNKFYVYGSKTISTTERVVFDNYLVEYGAATAGTSESNSSDWEYVNKTSKKGATQDIKYWDFSASQFDFVAVSGLGDDETITNAQEGMRIKVADADAMGKIFVSDRITATPTAKSATPTTPATVAYKNTVQFQFRRLASQMRIGFYEKIPGYAVKDLVFYYIGAPSGSYSVGVGSAFPKSGSYSVTYDDATNAAQVKFFGADNVMAFSNSFGQLDYTSAESKQGISGKPYVDVDGSATDVPVNSFLGSNKNEATYAKDYYTIDGEVKYSDYKPIMPNESNSLKMQLRVDYTLLALDGSGDEIHVRDAYVSVPINYLQWKPNYSYTYLFRISEKNTGYSGDGGGGTKTIGPGRDPDPDNGGGDNDPKIDPITGEEIPPYIPDPTWPEIPDPDDPSQTIPDPDAPLVPNPEYTTGPEGDQGDPSNPIPVPTVPDPTWPEIPDPENPGQTIPDPDAPLVPDPKNPATLFPITFDAVVVDAEDGATTVYTVVDGTDNSSETEH